MKYFKFKNWDFFYKSICFFAVMVVGITAQAVSFSVQEKTSSYTPYWFSGFTRADYALKLYDIGGGQVSSYSFVNFNYSRGPGKKYTVRIPFIISSAGWDQFEDKPPTYHKLNAFFEDPIFSIVDGSLALLPGDIQVYWEGRFYLAVGRQSRLENRIARFRNDFILSKNLARKWELNWVNKTNYYMQSRTTYITDIPQNAETGENLEVLTNTRQWRFQNWLTLWYKFNYDYGLGLQAGAKVDVYNQAPSQNRTKPTGVEYYLGPQFRFDAGNIGNMILSVSNRVDKSDFSELTKFNKDTVNVTLLAFYSF